ncbi:hypothetical protein FRC11_004111 [Ceratobasidium sp. 423]|nr:hypothetical protein FRC11_004111 [Ceratobasidium sp. 423]
MALGDLDEFALFPNRTELKVSLSPYAPLSLNTEQLELVFRYTLNLWRILGNKPYDSPSGELAYFVVPLEPDSKLVTTHATRTVSIEPFISWQEVNDLVSSRVRPLRHDDVEGMPRALLDGIIQDRPNDFTRRFENAKLREDLNPLSLIMREGPGEPQVSILDYYRKHRHEFEGIKNLQQPLIEATLLPGLANQLNPQEPLVQLTNNYLVPEMCYVSSIPASTFRIASLIPSVIWHIENVLIAKEVNLTFFQGQIRDELVMHALCSQVAHRTFNYERLEFLGDTFIKYAASAYLYGTEPGAPSRILHARRQKMVNNRSLWLGAEALGLPPCIQSEVFRPKQWFIPNVSIPKKNQTQGESSAEQAQLLSSRQFSRQIPPKAIADVVEAMIGAALLSGGEKLGFSVAKVLGFDVPKTCDWLDVVSYAPSKLTVTKEPGFNKETLGGVMKIIGVSLDNPELLLQAMALGDVVESLLGAIYVSSGFSISRVKMVYDRLLKPFYDRYIDKKAMLTHPMSRLMKKLESIGCRALGIAKSETQLANGGGAGFKCEVKIHGHVITEATCERAQQAITHATERALNELETQPDRILVNCTCRVGPQGKKRKRALEGADEGEIVEPLPGDDAEHPIDVDMFDF